jgi:hypothetical protein
MSDVSWSEPFAPREAWLAGVAVAFVVGLALVAAVAVNGSSFIYNSDANLTLRVARDPFGSGASFVGTEPATGVAYRYGRILYPLAAWLLAFGRPSLVAWTMPVVYAISVGLLVVAACALLTARGAPARRGLLLMAVPSFWVTLPIVFLDPVAVALTLAVYRLALTRRTAAARVTATATLLTREIAFIALLPFVWRDVREKRFRSAAAWLATAIPILVWLAVVRARFGEWGFRQPAGRGALSGPFAGYVRVVVERGALDGWYLAAALLGIVTVVAGVWVYRRSDWFPIAQAALLFSLLIVFFGPTAVRLPAQTIRLMLPAQMLILLAALGGLAPRARDRGAARREAVAA